MASSRLKFENMNTGKNKKSNAHERKTAIKQILASPNDPSLAFVQEFTWKKGLQKGAFKDFDIPEKYCFRGNEDSGFISDDSVIDCQRIDLETSVRRTYDQLAKESNEPIVFDLPRLCLCKIKGKDSPEFELLCACWHGPNNKVSDEKKKSHLRSLLRFLLKIKVERKLPLMIGGDFNLDSSKVDDVCGEISTNLKTISQSESIMMWVITDDFDDAFSLLNGYEERNPAFDHNVMTMEVQKVTEMVESTTLLTEERTEDLETQYVKNRLSMRGSTPKGASTKEKREETKREFKTDRKNESDFSEQVMKAKSTGRFEYHLKIKRTKENPNVQRLIVAHWEGTDAEYSDEAKKESLFTTINFLRDQLLNNGVKCDFDLPWLRKDVNVSRFDNAWIVSEQSSPQNEERFSIDLPFQLGNRSATKVDISLDIYNLKITRSAEEGWTVGGHLKIYQYPDDMHLEG